MHCEKCIQNQISIDVGCGDKAKNCHGVLLRNIGMEAAGRSQLALVQELWGLQWQLRLCFSHHSLQNNKTCHRVLNGLYLSHCVPRGCGLFQHWDLGDWDKW